MRQPRMFIATLFAAHISMTPAISAELPTLLISDAKAVTAQLQRVGTSAPRKPEQRPELAQRLRRWQTAGPVYLWNQEAVAALLKRQQGNLPASRVLALLHASLYDVAVVTEAARTSGSSYPGTATAMNSAAFAILAALIPAETERFRALADEGHMLHRDAGLETDADSAAGKLISEEVVKAALARSRDDGAQARWAGTVPTGPGKWLAASPPAGAAMPQWRTWVLASADALRPGPPPEFGSAQFTTALAEVKNYTRSPQATENAIFWHAYGGGRNYQMWHRELGSRALEHGYAQETLRMAAAFAALSIAYADAHIACWDAKYQYWYIRPSQADPSITTLVPLPSHPSYPSAHSCLSSAGASVLAALFPGEERQFNELTKQSGESRIAAGLHYRFDCEAGDEIGRRAAALALAKLAPALR
jgi:membrane-associated phospholipid phosphatase